MKCAETTAESVACLKTAVFKQTTQISDEGHHEADKTLGIKIFPLSEVVIFSLLVFQISELTIRSFLYGSTLYTCTSVIKNQTGQKSKNQSFLGMFCPYHPQVRYKHCSVVD